VKPEEVEMKNGEKKKRRELSEEDKQAIREFLAGQEISRNRLTLRQHFQGGLFLVLGHL
jgi:hypothetical protein